MGMHRLVLVNPARFPNPQAEWRAANALDVLDGAIVVDSLDEAIGDCALIYGTGMTTRRIPWPVVSPRAAAREVVASGVGETAILFGRETSGLTNEELRRCHKHIQIPANPEYGSLNLAMSVQVVCYELYGQTLEPDLSQTAHWDRRWATNAEFEGFLQHLDETLIDIDFYAAEQRGQSLTRLRRLFSRTRLDETEVQMLRGVLSQIRKQRERSS